MKMPVRYINSFLIVTVALSTPGNAQPSLQTSFMVEDERVYKDLKKTNLYYYLPFDYKLVTDVSGKPFFSLTQIRYTGTQTGGDAGTSKFSNLLQFKIAMDASQQKKVASLKASLKAMNASSELQMLPVRKFFSVVVFASSDDPTDISTDSVNIIGANLSEATDENAAVNNSYWNERVITLRLSNADAQLVASALKKSQSAMSFSYAIYSAFAEKTSPDISIAGKGKIRKQVAGYFQEQVNPSKDTAQRITLVKADAISLAVDINKWPSLIQQVDINERVPARYALFDVYCYDFNNELRPDLYEKKVEIKATSVSGTEITTTCSFKQARPDVYARSIRFMYAVKLDRPYHYRVTEINNEGEITATPWTERKQWSEILDITSPPEKVTAKPIEAEQ